MRRLLASVTVFVVAAVGTVAQASHDSDVRCRGNSTYTICADLENAIGRVTARTAAGHAIGAKSMLFGSRDDDPWSSFWTLHSFTSDTDYAPLGRSGYAFEAVDLSRGSTWSETSTGFRTRHQTLGLDDIEIIQTVEAVGDGTENAAVQLGFTIENTGAVPVDLGLRYLVDVEIGFDDGPLFRRRSPTASTWLATERRFPSPRFGYWEMQDNDVEDPSSPSYAVYGSALGPRDRGLTAPTELTFGCWDAAITTAFDFNPVNRNVSDDGNQECTKKSYGDSAVLYWFGRSPHDAISLAPGASTDIRFLLAAGPVDLLRAPFCHEDGIRARNGDPIAAGVVSERIADDVEPLVEGIPIAGGDARRLVHELNCDVVVPIEDVAESVLDRLGIP